MTPIIYVGVTRERGDESGGGGGGGGGNKMYQVLRLAFAEK